MRHFRIHNKKYDDSYTIQAETVEEVQEEVKKINASKGWKPDDCWSEEIK